MHNSKRGGLEESGAPRSESSTVNLAQISLLISMIALGAVLALVFGSPWGSTDDYRLRSSKDSRYDCTSTSEQQAASVVAASCPPCVASSPAVGVNKNNAQSTGRASFYLPGEYSGECREYEDPTIIPRYEWHYPMILSPVHERVYHMLRLLQGNLSADGKVYDGHIGLFPMEINDYIAVAMNPNVKTIIEVGMNAGHSTTILLTANPNARLITFTLAHMEVGAKFVREHYASRWELVEGDSRVTIDKWFQDHPDVSPDVLIIDGNHEPPAPFNDFVSVASHAKPGARYIFDGLSPDCDWVVEDGFAFDTFEGQSSVDKLVGLDMVAIGPWWPKTPYGVGFKTAWRVGVLAKVPTLADKRPKKGGKG